jgi:hypothetical protein
MHVCHCSVRHTPRRIVLTGGPGAGKTAVLEFVRMAFCRHLRVLPEAAGILFGGGFPRDPAPVKLQAAQRAIFHVQRQLEASVEEENLAIVLCDRGTVDGVAYWPGPESLFHQVGSTLEQELARYEMVIHLRTPDEENGYNFSNPLRTESNAEARAIDARISEIWSQHPRVREVKATGDFLVKVRETLETLRDEVPDCCRQSISPTLAG